MLSQWADLPKELLEMINKRLDSPVEVLRFRAVCASWRCSATLPSFDQRIPSLILKFPQPICVPAELFRTTVCRIELVRKYPNSSSSSSKSWLVKARESEYGKLKLLHPLTNHEISYRPIPLNLLDLKLVQLSNAFLLKRRSGFLCYGISKVVLFPTSARCDIRGEFGILAIFHKGKLGYWRYGDQELTLLDDKNFQYHDILEYKGQFYVVDSRGTVSRIDSSLKLIQYSHPLFGGGQQKNLVESCGDLYVVDKYIYGKRKTWKDFKGIMRSNSNISRFRSRPDRMPFDFRVYKLDQEWGNWVHVKSLHDRIFILGIDCSFSVSCREFNGGKGNCIYFTDDDFTGKGLTADGIIVFQLEDRFVDKGAGIPWSSEIFWPPDAELVSAQDGSAQAGLVGSDVGQAADQQASVQQVSAPLGVQPLVHPPPTATTPPRWSDRLKPTPPSAPRRSKRLKKKA